MKRISSFFILLRWMLCLSVFGQTQVQNENSDPMAPNIYAFENDTLWQEMQMRFLPNQEAIFSLKSNHKIHKQEINIPGECKLVKKSKPQPKSAVPDTLMKFTYRSLDRKLPLELQFDSHRRLARVFIPEQISQQNSCLWVSAGQLKKQSGNPSWDGCGVSDALKLIFINMEFPDSIVFVNDFVLSFKIMDDGRMADIKCLNREHQTSPDYPIVEKIIKKNLLAVSNWEPAYAGGIPRISSFKVHLLINIDSGMVTFDNPMDKIYPKTDLRDSERLRDKYRFPQ